MAFASANAEIHFTKRLLNEKSKHISPDAFLNTTVYYYDNCDIITKSTCPKINVKKLGIPQSVRRIDDSTFEDW